MPSFMNFLLIISRLSYIKGPFLFFSGGFLLAGVLFPAVGTSVYYRLKSVCPCSLFSVNCLLPVKRIFFRC